MTQVEVPGVKYRAFTPGGDARQVIAEVLARRDGRSSIPPATWAAAGAIVKAMREQGFTLRKPTP